MATLESLRKEAKRWLKALRAGDTAARDRLTTIWPGAPAHAALRDVQHALALEHGFSGWIALSAAYDAAVPNAMPAGAELESLFLYHACAAIVNGPAARVVHMNAAARLLRRHPDLRRASMYTATAVGNLEEVRRILAANPNAAREKRFTRVSDDPEVRQKEWEPLMFTCYARIPIPEISQNAVAVARLLLDHGADPNAHFLMGSEKNAPRYSCLTGVVGEGEEDAPPHPRREALTELLLERGAEPYDIQVFYNTHFHGNILWLLQLVHRYSLEAGREADWRDPEWSMIGMGGYGQGARYFLTVALDKNDMALADWLLAHGASPNAAPPSGSPRWRPPPTTLYEEAVRRGLPEMAELLVRYGAKPESGSRIDPRHDFVQACLRLERSAVERLLAQHPEFLRSHHAIFAAAREDRSDVVDFLLQLGTPIEVENKHRQRPLHAAAWSNALSVAALLIERGAEIDPVETQWDNTPLDFAVYEQLHPMIDFLSRYSNDVWNLVFMGKLDRLRQLLVAEPALARLNADGWTPLMRLPDDEERAMEIVELFLSNGADAAVRNSAGLTAADYAARRGMEEVARRLRD